MKESCTNCGRDLSKREVKKGVKECENCLEKKSSKITKGLAIGGGVLAGIAGIAAFVVTRGKKGKF